MTLNIPWKDWCWSWSSSTLATWCKELTHWKRCWCWERLKAGGEGDDRGWDGWMASPTQWTWVWVDSGSWWWAGRPGMLWFMGSQRVGHDWVTELIWTTLTTACLCVPLLLNRHHKTSQVIFLSFCLWIPILAMPTIICGEAAGCSAVFALFSSFINRAPLSFSRTHGHPAKDYSTQPPLQLGLAGGLWAKVGGTLWRNAWLPLYFLPSFLQTACRCNGKSHKPFWVIG